MGSGSPIGSSEPSARSLTMPAVLRLCSEPRTFTGSAPLRGGWHDDADMGTFEGYTPWLRANSCCDRTISDRLGVLADFAQTNPDFPDVSPAQITAWLGREGFAPWTRATYYGHLRSFYTFAAESGLLQVDPMARMRRPKPGKSRPRPLTPAQVAVVLAGARNANLHAWLTLALFAGLRAHEVAKVRGEDVGQDQLWVFGKGGVGEYVPTHPLIWELAQAMPTAGWWFPTRSACGHVTSLAVSTLTSRLFAAHGISGSLHRCRHTYATELLRAGVNVRVVQELMRHKSLASTMLYTEVTRLEKFEGIMRLVA